MQPSRVAADLKRQDTVLGRIVAAVIWRNQGQSGAQLGRRYRDLARIGTDPSVRWSELTREQQNVHMITSVRRRGSRHASGILDLLVIAIDARKLLARREIRNRGRNPCMVQLAGADRIAQFDEALHKRF